MFSFLKISTFMDFSKTPPPGSCFLGVFPHLSSQLQLQPEPGQTWGRRQNHVSQAGQTLERSSVPSLGRGPGQAQDPVHLWLGPWLWSRDPMECPRQPLRWNSLEGQVGGKNFSGPNSGSSQRREQGPMGCEQADNLSTALAPSPEAVTICLSHDQ